MEAAPRTILVVDDDRSFRKIACDCLLKKGYGVLESPDGLDCLIQAAARRPDLILLDLNMPGPDGVAVCRALFNQPATSAIPIVIVSGTTDKGRIVECIQKGAVDYLLKGKLTPGDLCARIDRILESRPAGSTTPPVAMEPELHEEEVPVEKESGKQPQTLGHPPSTEMPDLEGMLKKAAAASSPARHLKRIAEISAHPTPGIQDILDICNKYSSVAQKMSLLAKSPLFRLKEMGETLDSYARRLGSGRTACLATAVALTETFASRLSDDLVEQHEIWKHCVCSALIARFISMDCGAGGDAEKAFLAGLLHDAGKAVMCSYYSKEYIMARNLARQERCSIQQAETALFGTDHALLGGKVLARWSVPEELCEVALYHHLPWDAIIACALYEPWLAGVVKVADNLAKSLEAGDAGDDLISDVSADMLQDMGLEAAMLESAVGNAAEQLPVISEVLLSNLRMNIPPDAQKTVQPVLDGKKIVLFCDSPVTGLALQRHLVRRGAVIQSSAGLPQPAKILEQDDVSLICAMKYIEPAFAQKLATWVSAGRAIVIVPDEESGKEAEQMGIRDYLTYPFSLSRVVGTLSGTAKGSQAVENAEATAPQTA